MLIKKSDLLFENPYRKIYKYRLEEGGQTTIAAYWAELLDIQVQEDNIVLCLYSATLGHRKVWRILAGMRKAEFF